MDRGQRTYELRTEDNWTCSELTEDGWMEDGWTTDEWTEDRRTESGQKTYRKKTDGRMDGLQIDGGRMDIGKMVDRKVVKLLRPPCSCPMADRHVNNAKSGPVFYLALGSGPRPRNTQLFICHQSLTPGPCFYC